MKRLIAALALLSALLINVPAHAAVWTQPDVTTLPGSLAPGDGPWLELPWAVVWQFSDMLGAAELDPRAVERLPNGDTLITSRDGLGVYQVAPDGSVVWSFTDGDYPGLVPFHATRLANGHTLIVSRTQDTVLEVTPEKTIAWSYGSPDDDTKLVDPFTAFRLPDGNTLIADNQACRVIEVSLAGEIVWQYGHTGERAIDTGYQPGYLDWPKWATRLANGNTLIADDEGHRVVEITRDGVLVWSYGEPGVAGSGPGQLSNPVCAERLADGSTLIADSGNDRALTVAPDGTIVSENGTPGEDGLDELGLSDLRRAVVTSSGTLLIADTRNSRVLELGHTSSGLVTSDPIDCGLPGTRKEFTDIRMTVDLPAGTAALLQYSVDGGQWQTTSSGVLPAETYGTLIRYRISLTTDNPGVTPRLSGVTIGNEPAPAQAATDETGDGEGSPAGGGAPGTTTPSKKTRTRPGTATTPRPPSSGTMSSPEGYALGDIPVGESIAGPVSARRGWMLARVTPMVDADSLLRGSPAPLPSLEGLLLLGGLYVAGALSVPLGRAARAAASFVPTDY